MTLIVRERVSSQVQRYLRDKIIQGELQEGMRLIEADIAAELSVSRTPVREALVLLQSKDLVRALDGGGYEVRDFRRELMDILDVRVALESHAARRAVDRADGALIAQLNGICGAMEALSAEAVDRRAKLNREFHETLVGAAGNPRLLGIVNDYQEYFSAAQKLFDPEYITRTQREHREIVKALERHDAEGAARTVAAHIAGAGAIIAGESPKAGGGKQ